MDFNNETWGRDRMFEAIKQFSDCPADRVIRNVLGYRRRFAGLARQVDDTSVIAVKVGAPRKSSESCECDSLDDEIRSDGNLWG